MGRTEDSGKACPRGMSNCRVLVVEGEVFIADPLCEVLSAFGYRAEYVTSGREAVDRYHKALTGGDCYRAVIMDLSLPGEEGGRESLEELRKLDNNVRVLATGGYYPDAASSKFREFGFDDYVPKPYKIETILASLRKMLPQQ